jgi:hypothetical protein
MHKIRNFHEGHSTVGEWQGSGKGMAWERHGNDMLCVNRPLTRHGNGMVCESAFKIQSVSRCKHLSSRL